MTEQLLTCMNALQHRAIRHTRQMVILQKNQMSMVKLLEQMRIEVAN